MIDVAVDIESTFRLVQNWKLNAKVSRARIHPVLVENRGGDLSGDYPDGITAIEGVPGPADIRVLVRSIDPAFDGMLVAKVRSGPDGTWRVSGLDTRLKYDVVCRHEGYNDMILSNVSPMTD